MLMSTLYPLPAETGRSTTWPTRLTEGGATGERSSQGSIVTTLPLQMLCIFFRHRDEIGGNKIDTRTVLSASRSGLAAFRTVSDWTTLGERRKTCPSCVGVIYPRFSGSLFHPLDSPVRLLTLDIHVTR